MLEQFLIKLKTQKLEFNLSEDNNFTVQFKDVKNSGDITQVTNSMELEILFGVLQDLSDTIRNLAIDRVQDSV